MDLDTLWRIGETLIVAAAAWGSVHYEVRMLDRWMRDHESRIRILEQRQWKVD